MVEVIVCIMVFLLYLFVCRFERTEEETHATFPSVPSTIMNVWIHFSSWSGLVYRSVTANQLFFIVKHMMGIVRFFCLDLHTNNRATSARRAFSNSEKAQNTF